MTGDVLQDLDEDQRVVAETLRGPVCVLAGAGTGKTRAITHRIAHGVATGTYASNRVLALTFTNRAAAELRGRLRALGAGNVPAKTFHAAALSQLGYFWPQVIGGDLPRVIEGKGKILGQAAERLRLDIDTATLRDLAAEIEWRKVSGHGIEDYATSGRAAPGDLTVEQTVDMLRAYESLKDERRQIDFEDVLLLCAGMLEQEPRVAMHVREQYRFFVVDEYQDVSALQQQLLDLWLGDRRDLCVVGDASQTIFSFAGASSSFLLDFPSRYDNSSLIRLERNYRSVPAVVGTANHLMRDRPGALTLHAVRAAEAEWPGPEEVRYSSDVAEARGIAASIRSRLEDGVRPEDIAVLYRVNAQSAVLESALTDAGVSFHLRGSTRFFDLPEVRQAVMALRGASVAAVDEPLFKSVSDVLRSLGWSQIPPEGHGAVRAKWESLNALMGLVDQAPSGTTFRQFTDDLLERQAGQHEPTMQAVTLATLHSAKGMEWDEVYIPGIAEGLLPISYARSQDEIDEERRLLYVGMTRARRRLTLSWSRMGQRRQNERSRFLQEIGSRTTGEAGARRRSAARAERSSR